MELFIIFQYVGGFEYSQLMLLLNPPIVWLATWTLRKISPLISKRTLVLVVVPCVALILSVGMSLIGPNSSFLLNLMSSLVATFVYEFNKHLTS